MCGSLSFTHPVFRTPTTSSHQTIRSQRTVQRSMEMWKVLTQKFKHHCLDEVQAFPAQDEVEDRDSGTESDEENAELQAIEEAMQSKRDQENFKPQVLTSVVQYTMAGSPKYHPQSPVQSLTSPVNSLSKRPFPLVNQGSIIPFQPLSHNTSFAYNTHLERESPAENSDYERCSLDYEPGSSTEFDHHSSEDELAIINCNHDLVPEKRKWSQMNRCNSCEDSSGSSDEEIRDIFMEPRPLNFSSSPPKGVQKLSHTLSPTLFLANLSPKNMRLCCVSPRKRHRQMTSDLSDATVIQRPCLDFEKMQKTLFRKHVPHGINKARIVKIRVGLLKGAL